MAGDSPLSHSSDWPIVSLADIVTKIGSGATPRGGADTYLSIRLNFALIRSQNVFDRRFDSSGLAFISDDQAQGLSGVVLREGDILLNITGDGVTFGRACIVPNFALPACVNQHVAIIRVDPAKADPGYILSFLTHPEIKPYIESFNSGGSRRAITKGHIESFKVGLPPLPTQRAITHILGTLDDKIELNRRTNETLEAMARALFKSWFVDFDPVDAKARGQALHGMDAATAALFPSEFEDSELGPIPKGWSCEPLGEWVDVFSGGTPSKQNGTYWGGSIPWVSPKVMTSIHADQAENFVTETAVGNGTRMAPAGATLVMVRGMGLHQKVRVSQAQHELTFNQDVKALVGIRIEPTLLLYAALDGQQVLLGRVESSGHGTGRLPSDVLLSHPITMPGERVQQGLAQPFININQRIASLRNETGTLGRLRDALLPRLLSGELSVAEAERSMEGKL